MLNKAFLQGRLVADPELRHTQSGVAMTTFRLAVDRDFKDRETGERKADFFNVVTWRQTAEFASRFLAKGRLVIVEGRIQNREYTDRDGNRRFATDIVADSVHFGESRRDSDNNFGGGYGGPARGGYQNNAAPAPQGAAGGYNATPAADQFADLTDDDGELPF